LAIEFGAGVLVNILVNNYADNTLGFNNESGGGDWTAVQVLPGSGRAETTVWLAAGMFFGN
jgi:hypothetical protein